MNSRVAEDRVWFISHPISKASSIWIAKGMFNKLGSIRSFLCTLEEKDLPTWFRAECEMGLTF